MLPLKSIYASLEEYDPIVVDQFGRFRCYLSQNPCKLEPAVSKFLFREGFRPTYKNGKKFAVCISHDVDNVYDRRTRREAVMDSFRSLKNRDLPRLSGSLRQLSGPKLNPDWFLEQFLDLEKKYAIPATYYFLALEKQEWDFNYYIDQMAPYFAMIREAGGEIGLHGGHEAYNSREKIASERAKLEKACGEPIFGYRNHFLRFKTPQTWEHLASLGFVYDTTFGYADMIGYRNGMCYPFRPFDPRTNTFMDILELPLILMDCTFWKYMGLDMDQSFRLFRKIVDDVKAVNGVLTILWHNHSLKGEEGVLFHRIIDYLVKDQEAWFSTSMELALFWKENHLPTMESIVRSNLDSVIFEPQQTRVV